MNLVTGTFYLYRRYIWQAAWEELRHRYAGTGLGIYWNLINPVLEVLIYTAVFTRMFIIRSSRDLDAPFVLYLCVGLFPWLAFTETVIQGGNAFLDDATYLRRLALPAEIFVAKRVLFNTFNLTLMILLLLPFSLWLGEPLSWSWLVLPFLVVLLQGLGLGLALALACLRVLLPDIGEILRALMQLWKWTMPIVYPMAVIPEAMRLWLPLNPPYLFIQSIRAVFLKQQLPSLVHWTIMLGWLLLFGVIGAVTTRKLQAEIRDNL